MTQSVMTPANVTYHNIATFTQQFLDKRISKPVLYHGNESKLFRLSNIFDVIKLLHLQHCNIIYLSLIGRIVNFWQMLFYIDRKQCNQTNVVDFSNLSLGNIIHAYPAQSWYPWFRHALPNIINYKFKQKLLRVTKELCIFDQPFYRILLEWRIFQHIYNRKWHDFFYDDLMPWPAVGS